MSLWHALENPFFYRLSQWILAPGLTKMLLSEIRAVTNGNPAPKWQLDIGCGPFSLLWEMELEPVGLDTVHACLVRFRAKGERAVAGSSTALPFRNNSYGAVWNFGLLHHLSNEEARQSIQEMIRVTHPGGIVVIFDGVLPVRKWLSLIPWLIRLFDRGRHMRTQAALESLLVDPNQWRNKRLRYTYTGLEGVLCVYRKSGSVPPAQ